MSGVSMTLKRFVIWGGIVSLGGSGFMAWKIHYDFRQQQYYVKTLELFNGYPIGVQIVGPPITVKRLDLGNTDTTWSDGLNARIAIPLSGQKKKAILHSWSHRLKPGEDWTVDKCDMEISKKRWTFYINPKSSDMFKATTGDSGEKEFPKQWILTDVTRNAVTGADQQSNAVTGVDQQSNAVTGADQQSNAVTGADQQSNAVTGADQQSNAVTGADQQSNAVTGADQHSNVQQSKPDNSDCQSESVEKKS